MPIREQGYYNWNGELKGGSFRWFPIFSVGIESVYKKRFAKLFFASFASVFFIFLIALYVSSKPELKIFTRLVNIISNDKMLFRTFYTNGFSVFMSAMLCIFAGAELISSDIKHNSVSLYLARPLGKSDYIAGKYSIILFYLLAFSLLPGLLLLMFKMIFTGSLSVGFSLLLKSILFPVVISLFWASAILMFSSLSSNARFVKIVFFSFYFFTDFIGKLFYQVFNDGGFLYLSLNSTIRQFGSFVFGTSPQFKAPEWISGVIMLSLTVIFTGIVFFRMKRMDI